MEDSLQPLPVCLVAISPGIGEKKPGDLFQLLIQTACYKSFPPKGRTRHGCAVHGKVNARFIELDPDHVMLDIVQMPGFSQECEELLLPGSGDPTSQVFDGVNGIVVDDKFYGKGVVGIDQKGQPLGLGPTPVLLQRYFLPLGPDSCPSRLDS